MPPPPSFVGLSPFYARRCDRDLKIAPFSERFCRCSPGRPAFPHSTAEDVMTKRARLLALGAVLAVATPGARGAAADEPPRQAITVRVYDYTAVPDAMLSRSKQDVSRIYRLSGVDITWIEARDPDRAASFEIQIIIRRRSAASATSAAGSIMGTSLGDTHDVGGSAFVFRDRVTRVAHERNQDVARVLGYAMAHEMGHLLLPYPAHSTTGMMRGEWDGDDLRHIADGTMLFTPAQTMLIRAKAAGCCDARSTAAK
jgi:hypothetical protein